MTVYNLRNIASDLGGGTDFSDKVLTATGTAATIGASIAAFATETSRFFTEPGVPNNADWQDGTITVVVRTGSGMPSGMFLKIQLHRVNSFGTVQESQTISAEQSAPASTTLTFTFSSLTWSAGAAGDRLRIDFAMRNSGVSAQTFRFVANDGQSTVTTAISENVNPTPGTLALSGVAPTITKGALTMSPSPATMALAVPSASITLGALTLTPTPVTMTLNTPAVAIGKGTLQISPDPVVMTLAEPTPTVSVQIVPSPAEMTLAVPSVTMQFGAITMTPDPVLLSLSVPVVAAGQAVIRPDPTSMSLAVPDISISVGVLTLTPSPVQANLQFPLMQIIKSTTTVFPDATALVLSVPDLGITVGVLVLDIEPVQVFSVVPIPHSFGPPSLPPYRMIVKAPVARRVVFDKE